MHSAQMYTCRCATLLSASHGVFVHSSMFGDKPNLRYYVLSPSYRLQCPVTLKTVEDGEHRLSRPQDIELIIQALGALLNPEDSTEPED